MIFTQALRGSRIWRRLFGLAGRASWASSLGLDLGIKSFQIQEGFLWFFGESVATPRRNNREASRWAKSTLRSPSEFFLRRSEIFSNFLTLRLPQSVII